MPNPAAHQGDTNRRPFTAAVEPGVHAKGGREQRTGLGCRWREGYLRALNLAILIEIRRGQPLMQSQRVTGRLENHPAIDDTQRMVHAHP